MNTKNLIIIFSVGIGGYLLFKWWKEGKAATLNTTIQSKVREAFQ